MDLSLIQKLNKELWDEVQDAVWHCIAYKTDVLRKDGEKPVPLLGWNGSDAFLIARDSLQYKSDSLVWHVGLLQNVVTSYSKKSEESFLDAGENLQVRYDAMHKVAYIFDDIVFICVSLFDYLSELIYVAHFPEIKGSRLWSKSVQNTGKLKDYILAELIQEINRNWVKPLSRYRGHIIHNKAEMGSVGMTFSFSDEGLKFTHEYELPEKLVDSIDFLHENPDLMTGALIMAKRTLEYSITLVKVIGSFEYELKRSTILD